jgi:hypothetical protein
MQPNTAPNETKLPRAVLRRSAAIQARIDARNAPAEPENPNPAGDAAPAAGQATPPAQPADPQPPAHAGDPRDSDPAYWKQRFSVTEGILRTERAARTAQTEGLHQRVAELEGQLRSLQATAKPTEKIDITQFYTPEQIAQYGEEQCEVMAETAMRAATSTAQKLIDAAVQPIKQERDRAAANDATNAKQAFTDKLTELYPNWAVADVDPSWLAWLAEEDENEVVRQTLLNVYIEKGNATGAARMFRNWEKATAPRTAPKLPAPPVAPSGSGANPGPENPGAPAPASASDATPPTEAEIKDFFKRAATIRPGRPGYVTDSDRVKFDARLALRNGNR